MTDSFAFNEVEFFTVGTLGPRGERVFYLQGRGDGQLVSLRLEKQQVATLADYLERVLDDLPEAAIGPLPSDLTLREPVVSAWTVGQMGVAYAADDDRLIVIAEEMVVDELEVEPASARFVLRREQVIGLIDRARDVVSAGRTPCPFCGTPLQPRNGGWCACSN
ncbi:MAG: DUF3090 family protein [Acidimicrobiales bacterium]|jgi:uncharacterized repeat protein (TIGR03847 family)